MNVSSRVDPINALASHFRFSGSTSFNKHGALRVPSLLRNSLNEKLNPPERLTGKTKVSFAAGGVQDLVESIGKEEFERWCLLDGTAFTFVTKILLEAEPCLAKDQGLFRMIEALETLKDENSELAMPKELLVNYKDIIGDSLAVELLNHFVEAKVSELSRRWAGLLLAELLTDSEANRERLWKIPDKTFKSIGEIIISGNDRMLKVVAGKIVWQMMQVFDDEEEIRYRLPIFCQPSEAGDFTKDFPLQDGSQWENGFVSFITSMEGNRYDLDIGLPTSFNGCQVKIGDSNPINTEFGAISISVAEIFSIYIPPNRDRSHDWVDFKIVNISKIEFTSQGVTGDAMKDLTYFKLHLCDYEEDGYLYLLSMRPSSDSDNVMILCDKADADDFVEDVKRYKSKVLKRKPNRLPMSSAPMKDIQANPAHHQSKQAKLDELKRHRDDISKALESPRKSHAGSVSVTDPDENESSSSPPIGGREESKGSEEESANPVRIEGEMSGPGSGNPGQGSRPSPVPKQRTSTAIESSRGLVEMPDIVSGEIKEVPSSNPQIPHTTDGHLDGTFGVISRNLLRRLRSPVRVGQAISNSDSELTDVTDIPDEPQLELLFEGVPVRRRITEKPAKLQYDLRNTFKAAGSKTVGRLEFPAKGGSPAAGLNGRLGKKPEAVIPLSGLNSRLGKKPEAVIPLAGGSSGALGLGKETKKIPQPIVPSKPLLRDTSAMKSHPELNHALKQKSQSGSTGIIGALERTPEVAEPVEVNRKQEGRPATRNFSGLPDDVLAVGEPVEPENSLVGDDKSLDPNIVRSLDNLVKEQAVQSRNKAEMKPQLLGPGGSMVLDTSVDESFLGRGNTANNKPRYAVPKIDGKVHNAPATKNHKMLKDDLKKESRPAAPNPSWLVNITPLSTDEASYMVQQRGKLKDRLTGKARQSVKAKDETTTPNPAQRPRKIVANLEKPGLISPEDTSIWDLPDSEGSGKDNKSLPKKGRGKSKIRSNEVPLGAKPSRAKRKPGPKKQVYGKKPAINPEPKSNEVILDSDEEMKSAEEELPVRAPIHRLKPRKKSSLRSAKANGAVVRKREDEAVVSVENNKLSSSTSGQTTAQKAAPASAPAKGMITKDTHKGMSLAGEKKLPAQGQGVKPETTSSSVLVKRAAVNKGGNEESSLEKEQNSPTRSTKLEIIQMAARASVPTKRMAGWDSSPVTKRKKPEYAKKKTTLRPLRPTAKKAPRALTKHPRFNVHQHTSEADENSSWKPKTRLQAKIKSTAKPADRAEKADEIVNGKARKGSEASREVVSSDESSDGSQGMSSPTTRSGKTQKISSDSRVLFTGVSDPGALKRDPPSSSEISVEMSEKIHRRRNEIKRTEAPREGKLHLTERLDPEVLTQPKEGNHTEQDESDVENNPNDKNFATLNNDSGSGLRATDTADLKNSGEQKESHGKFSSHKWLVIAGNEPVMSPSAPKPSNATTGLAANKSEAEHQLRDDIEMPDRIAGGQDVEDKQAKELQKQDISSVTGRREQDENQAPTAVMNLGTPNLPLMDVTGFRFPRGSSQNSTSLGQKGPKLIPLVTSRRLDRTPKTPLVNPDALIDNHLARKVQIISWGSDGPKNQGRNTAAEQIPMHLNEQIEFSINNEARVHDPARPLSLFVLASEDEDRIVRRKKGSSPFIVHPFRRSMEVMICKNESPFLAAASSEQVDTVKSPRTDNSLEERNGGEEEGMHFPILDVGDDIVEVDQKSSEEEGQKRVSPIAIKKPKGSRRLSRINIWDTSDTDIDSEIEVVSSNEGEAALVTDPLEESTISTEDSEPVAAKGEASRACREDRQISVIEISDDEPKEAEVMRRDAVIGPPITRTWNSWSSPFQSKQVLLETPSHPTSKEMLVVPSNHLILAQNKSLALQSLPSAARKVSPGFGDDASNVKGNIHHKSTFFKWLNKRNYRATHQEFSKKPEDPDKTLVNEGDFDEIGHGFTGNSEEAPGQEPGRGRGRGRDLLETDSDGSSDFSMSNDKSDSDEDEESSEDETPQLAWRQSIPDHHGETLAVLDQISQGLLRYLMSGEELAMEVIKDFEKQGNEIVGWLGESHKNEYEDFLLRVEAGKQNVMEEHTAIMEAVESDIAKLQEEKVALVDLRAKMNDNYNTIEDTITRLMVQLKGELEGAIMP